MRTRLPRDIEQLRADLGRKLSKSPAFRYVVTDILWHLGHEIWGDEQGVPSDTARLLDTTLSPLFDAVLRANDLPEIHAAVDALARAWDAALPDRWG